MQFSSTFFGDVVAAVTVIHSVKGLALVEGVLVRAARACVAFGVVLPRRRRSRVDDGGTTASRRGDGLATTTELSRGRGDAIAATVARSRTPRQTALARDRRAPPQTRLGPPLRHDGLADLLEVV